MNQNERNILTRKINAAFRRAMTDVIRQAKQTGTPIIVWKDGRVQEVSAEEAEQDMLRRQRKRK